MLTEQVMQWFFASRQRGDSGSGARKAARIATLAYYKETLGHFQQFLEYKGITDFAEVSRHTIRDYVTHIQQKPWAESTKYKAFRGLRAFLRFVELDEDCQEAGLKALRRSLPTIPKAAVRPTIPPKADFQRLLNSIPTKKRSGHRDYVVMSLMLETGMRIGEVCFLRLDHLQLDENRIIVPQEGKTGPRLLPITPSMSRLLRTWLRRRQSFAKCDRLFVTDTGTPLRVDAVGYRFRQYCDRAGIQHISPHDFRHAFCTFYLERGGDLAKLRRLTGHSSYDILEVYLHLSTASLAEEHAKVNPRDAVFSKCASN